jgi:ABC-2 type transport system ATP-binding protein
MQPIISMQDVHKAYGDTPVLKGINLTVFPGQIIGYIGPSGAGKSTTVKLLTGLLSDYSGTILINGNSLKDHVLETKKIMGYVPENAELYELLTPMEFLRFTGIFYGMEERAVEVRALRMLEALGLAGYEHQRMDTFSKGMKQRVLLTSGLLHDPQIIILDEPLSGLDANAVILVKEILVKLKEAGKTIFYCSHMMDVVERISDRIILIQSGEIIANGTIEELRKGTDDSLETIFRKLTGDQHSSARAEAFAQTDNPLNHA